MISINQYNPSKHCFDATMQDGKLHISIKEKRSMAEGQKAKTFVNLLKHANDIVLHDDIASINDVTSRIFDGYKIRYDNQKSCLDRLLEFLHLFSWTQKGQLGNQIEQLTQRKYNIESLVQDQVLIPTNDIGISAIKKEPISKSYKASISLHITKIGHVGVQDEQNFIPEYLKEITLKDGSSLPMAPEDIFVCLSVNHTCSALQEIGFPSGNGALYLPSEMFKDKNEGDVIQLKYREQLIELTIQQAPHGSKDLPQEFKPLLNTMTNSVENDRNVEAPLFFSSKPIWWYVGNGCILRPMIEKNQNKSSLQEREKGTLREYKNPQLGRACQISFNDSAVFYSIQFAGFKLEDIDLILNDKLLIIYGYVENRPIILNCKTEDCEFQKIKEGSPLKRGEDGYLAYFPFLSKRESIFKIKWDKEPLFKGMNLENIKEILKASSLIMDDTGYLSLSIPRDLFSSERFESLVDWQPAWD
jgi:hypothetical protein